MKKTVFWDKMRGDLRKNKKIESQKNGRGVLCACILKSGMIP
jgi:hypothetical protein